MPESHSRIRKRRKKVRDAVYLAAVLCRDHQYIDFTIWAALERKLREQVTSDPSHTRIDLLLVSPGGMAKYAYLIWDLLRSKCCWLRAVVPAYATSAATMLVLGCDEIYMGPGTCLGPLDIQMERSDSNGEVCGLDVIKSLKFLSDQAAKYLLHMAKSLQEGIDLSADHLFRFAADLFERVLDKADPLWMVQVERGLKLPIHYLLEMLESRACRAPAGFSAAEVAKQFIFDFTSHDQAIRSQHAAALGLPIVDIDTHPYINQLREVYDTLCRD